MYSLIPQVKTKISFFSLLAFVTSTDNDDRQGAPHRLSFALHGTLEKKRGDPGGDLVKKAHVFTLLFIFMLLSGRLWAGTFFLYIEESCNGERGLFMTGTREGILDTFFENNQIIYDDMSDKGAGNRILSRDVIQPLATARRGGADFLLAVDIQSTLEKVSAEPKAPEYIKSTCAYFLYEVETGRLLTQGKLSLEKKGLAEKKERDELGFELGCRISRDLDTFFTQ